EGRIPGTQAPGQTFCLITGDRPKGRLVPFLVPDAFVCGPGPLGPAGKNHQLQNRLPDQARNLDHPTIAQKLREVAAHRPVISRVGSSEIDQQHPYSSGCFEHSMRIQVAFPGCQPRKPRICSTNCVTCSGGVFLSIPWPRLKMKGPSPRVSRMRATASFCAFPPASKTAGSRLPCRVTFG